MFSKKRQVLILCLTVLVCIWGCSNDHDFVDTEAVVSLAYDTNCLDRLEPDFELYRQELLSDKALREDFKCLRDAFDYVKLRVEGEERGSYTTDEMKRFLNKILFKNEAKSDLFFKNLVEVKHQIFGGEQNKFTFSDFDNFKMFLDSAEDLAVKLKPYAAELIFDEPFQTAQSVDAAVLNLMPFLGRWLKFTGYDINIETAMSLLTNQKTIGFLFSIC